jgi:hypothetical protein
MDNVAAGIAVFIKDIMDDTPRGFHVCDFEKAVDVPLNDQLYRIEGFVKSYSF